MKNTTPIPPGIASPDKVETRLGTLSFFDGSRLVERRVLLALLAQLPYGRSLRVTMVTFGVHPEDLALDVHSFPTCSF
jgi:hypothetical protein